MRGDPPLVLGVGEVLWDYLEEGRRPGGAPANVAFQAGQLGARAAVCSRVGTDPDGDQLIAYLEHHGLETAAIQRDSTYPTSRAEIVRKGPHDQHFDIKANVAWDYLEFDDQLSELASRADAVCFGTLGQRSETARHTIHRCLEATSEECLLVYDVNLRPPWYERSTIERSLIAAGIVKLNQDELRELTAMFDLEMADLHPAAETLRKTFNLDRVYVTRGADGCFLVNADNSCDVSGIDVRVADTVGAGDAFSAAAIVGELHGWPLERIGEFANRVAACIARQPGAMAPLDADLVRKSSWNAA